MPEDNSELVTKRVVHPQVASVLYQAETLSNVLNGFTDTKYPRDARRINDVLRLLGEHVHQQILELDNVTPDRWDSNTSEQLLKLAKVIRVLYACVRYLQASISPHTPPSVQAAISNLVSTYVPAILGCDPLKIVVVIRPQWDYNVTFVDLFGTLAERIQIGDLDPNGELLEEFTRAGTRDPDEARITFDLRALIKLLWRKRSFPCEPPEYAAVLSFAGLDRDNVLFYPLLAHEIGHFIDFSYCPYPGTVVDHPDVMLQEGLPTISDIQSLQDRFFATAELPEELRTRRAHKGKIQVHERVRFCLREITADLLATRMLGLPFFIAFSEYLKTCFTWPEPMIIRQAESPDAAYPGIAFRLKTIWDEVTDMIPWVSRDPAPELLPQEGLKYLRSWHNRLAALSWQVAPAHEAATPELALDRVVEQIVQEVLPRLRTQVRRVIPAESTPQDVHTLPQMVRLLRARVPPFQALLTKEKLGSGLAGVAFADVLTSGWLYQISVGEPREKSLRSVSHRHREYQDTCDLLFKAIELAEAKRAVEVADGWNEERPRSARPEVEPIRDAGAASGPYILDALIRGNADNLRERLIVVPYYGDAAIGSASWDLHLGHWFRIARRTTYTKIDLAKRTERNKVKREGQEEVYVPFDDVFVLHPGDFALGISLEYVCLPNDLIAYVEGKSGLGRSGLLVATATQVAPGFKGCVVLELCNTGTVPLILRPGMRIAQLVFHITDRNLPKEWLYAGRFRCQVKP